MERLLNTLENLEASKDRQHLTTDDEILLKEAESAKQKFEEAMDDDFNTALAISTILELARTINIHLDKNAEIEAKTKEKTLEILRQLLDVLGIEKEKRKPERSEVTEQLLGLIIKIRQEARERRDWKTADTIRDELESIGFIIEDTPEGTRWKTKEF